MGFGNREHFQRMLAEYGITDPQGVELSRLIKMTANAYETILADHLRDEKLSGPRYRLLFRLYMEEKRTGGGVSPSYLSKTQNVSRNTISALLRSLEDQGLILRTLDPDDRRQFNIQLSETGRELVEISTPEHLKFLNQIISDLSREEQDQLADLLVKLHGSLVTHGNLAPPCPTE